VLNEGDEVSFTPQPYSLFSGADDSSESSQRSDALQQEMIDLMTLQRLLCLAADDTSCKVNFVHRACC